MKREFIFKFGIVLSLIFLITENVSAQYADLTADKEEHINSKAIYIRKSNRYNLEAVQILDSTHPYAIFQWEPMGVCYLDLLLALCTHIYNLCSKMKNMGQLIP